MTQVAISEGLQADVSDKGILDESPELNEDYQVKSWRKRKKKKERIKTRI